MKIKIFIILLFFVHQIYGQPDCECKTSIINLSNKVENEYPGFIDKVEDSVLYKNFKNNLIKRAENTKEEDCFEILQEYVKHFKDGHLQITSNHVDNDELQVIEMIKMKFTDYKKQVKKSEDKLAGIWTSGKYKVGILKIDTIYHGLIFDCEYDNWNEGEVKFKIYPNRQAVIYNRNHILSFDSVQIVDNIAIKFLDLGMTFIKDFPESYNSNTDSIVQRALGFYLDKLSKQTLYLKLSSFGYQHIETINSLIKNNHELLSSHKNLIIDVRGNGGGTDYAYRPIMKYLYSKPTRHIGADYYVTSTLIEGLSNWVETADKEKYADDIKEAQSDIKRMQGKIGQFIPYNPDAEFWVNEEDTVLKYPENIVILADKFTASSAEKFIYNAKQSKKVKIMGTPTYGAMDYLSLREFDFSCDGYQLYMPTIRMSRLPDYPIDNIGIQPDIYLDKFVEDWIEYAKEYIEYE